MDGVELLDNPKKNEYPMPITAHKKDDVFVGRLRQDESQNNTLNTVSYTHLTLPTSDLV